MQTRVIVATDADFSAWYDCYLSSRLADYPDGPGWLEHELRVLHEPAADHNTVLWLAENGPKTVGAAVLRLPLRDNTALGEIELFVRPEARRQGVGTALLRVVEETAAAHGRTSLVADIEGPAKVGAMPGTAFAERHGFTRRITELTRVLRPPVDLATITNAEEAGRPYAAGYEIITWRDQAPDTLVHQVARLEARLSVDAPLGELDYEGEVWDDVRVRVSEQRIAAMGRGSWNAGAVAADGSLAGYTTITMADAGDERAFQDTTIVDPEHRGHRLGLLIKVANLRALLRDRPDVQSVWTWNADSNEHMIAINDTLGFRVEGWLAAYQRDL